MPLAPHLTLRRHLARRLTMRGSVARCCPPRSVGQQQRVFPRPSGSRQTLSSEEALPLSTRLLLLPWSPVRCLYALRLQLARLPFRLLSARLSGPERASEHWLAALLSSVSRRHPWEIPWETQSRVSRAAAVDGFVAGQRPHASCNLRLSQGAFRTFRLFPLGTHGLWAVVVERA